MTARSGAPSAGTFASLLDQFGQSPLAATATPVPGSDANQAAAPATVDQPSPAATPAPPVPLPPAAPVPAAATLGPPNPQPIGASAVTGPKTADKKLKSDTAGDPETTSPPSIEAATAPVTTPDPLLPPAAAPTPVLAASPAAAPPPIADAATSALEATAGSVASAPPPPATPVTTAASTKASSTTVASRIADQAAAATQAGLSVSDEGEDEIVTPEPQAAPRAATAATAHADPAPSALIMPPASPQLAGVAAPAPIQPLAPARSSPSPSTRPSQLDAPVQASNPSKLVTELLQPVPSSTPETQTVTPSPLPANALAAAGPTVSTRPTQDVSPPPSPAAQVAQAIVEPVKVVLTSPAQAGSTTPHVTTIQITPVELGRVEVRIERINDGPAKIELIAERPETLSRLVHDQSQLAQALDNAGVSQTGRTIEFSLAPAATNASAFSSNLLGNNASGDGSPNNGFQRQSNSYFNQNMGGADDTALASTTHSRTVRSGIDITA